MVKEWFLALASVVQLIGALSYRPRGSGFDFQSGHIPRVGAKATDAFLTLMFFSLSNHLKYGFWILLLGIKLLGKYHHTFLKISRK